MPRELLVCFMFVGSNISCQLSGAYILSRGQTKVVLLNPTPSFLLFLCVRYRTQALTRKYTQP